MSNPLEGLSGEALRAAIREHDRKLLDEWAERLKTGELFPVTCRACGETNFLDLRWLIERSK